MGMEHDYYEERDDSHCSICGEEIEVEFNESYTGFPSPRYVGYCKCAREHAAQLAEKEALRERYDLRGGGARDRAFIQPTLGDLLRKKGRCQG